MLELKRVFDAKEWGSLCERRATQRGEQEACDWCVVDSSPDNDGNTDGAILFLHFVAWAKKLNEVPHRILTATINANAKALLELHPNPTSPRAYSDFEPRPFFKLLDNYRLFDTEPITRQRELTVQLNKLYPEGLHSPPGKYDRSTVGAPFLHDCIQTSITEDQLVQLILEAHPKAADTRGGMRGGVPLHSAARCRPRALEFMKRLVNSCPKLLSRPTSDKGVVPLHI
jgi:hypothetical protein